MIDRFWKGTCSVGDHEADERLRRIIFECDPSKTGAGRRIYYAVKPFLPRFLQMFLRRLKAKGIRQCAAESAERHYISRLQEAAASERSPFYFIWFWPRGFDTASVITHDIETDAGMQKAIDLAEIDHKHGFRAAFNFVPERYDLDVGIMTELRRRGFEIGVHGLKHDGRLFDSRSTFAARAVKIREYARQWDAVGFRSPSLLRNLDWLGTLDFEWDSSCPDDDPYGPQPGGCRTVFPFFLSAQTVELPVTLMQDHTLFKILGKRDIAPWQAKLAYISSCWGLANVIVHPDYIFADGLLKLYERYLECLEKKSNMWHALPREVARWWKARDQSRIESDGERSGRLVGPAAAKGMIASYDELKKKSR